MTLPETLPQNTIIQNKAQLITYPDSLGGTLRALHEIISTHFEGVFSGVHILPPFPSSGDRGFAPVNYFEIDPRFGDWKDVRALGERVDVLVDLMVNHISRQSPYFQDFIRHGRDSQYAGLFITLDKIWPDGNPPQADLDKLTLRRPKHPFSDIEIEATGKVERVWTTFGFGKGGQSEQIDLDVHHPDTRRLFLEVLAHMRQNGVKMVRLDAAAYVIKKPGTNCFFVEPELYEFMDWIHDEARAMGIELLPEIHAELPYLMKLAARGYWVYNFALPLLVLHTLINKDSRALADHLRACPRKQVTTLDCHDGIPVLPDVDGLLPAEAARRVVEICLERGANLTPILNPAYQKQGLDVHQINITYYSALNCDDDAYLAARAIQVFSPGIPQVYYVGLLAGANRPEEVERQGDRRAINRYNYTCDEVETEMQRPAVQRLMRLLRFRNEHPAFQGSFTVQDTAETDLRLAWQNGEHWCRLHVDLEAGKAAVEYSAPGGETRRFEP